MGSRIRALYSCVSYEATKRFSRWQRVYKRGTTPASCISSTGMPAQNAANILKPLVPNPHSPLLHIVQHVTDWVAPFPRSLSSILSLPTNSSIFPLHLPSLLLSLMCTRVKGNYHHHDCERSKDKLILQSNM